MIDTTPVIVFARLKQDTHCGDVINASKRFNIFWQKDRNQILCQMEKTFYECERNFLIKHPFLSCFTEIQLIKPKRVNKYKEGDIISERRYGNEVHQIISLGGKSWILNKLPVIDKIFL